MKDFGLFSLLCCFAILLAVAPLLVNAQTENTWATKVSMPSARAGFGVAEVNGKIYAMGGWDKTKSNFYTVNEVYEPATNTWTQKTPMLSARVSFAVAVYQGKIYTFGGQVLDAAGHRIVINVTEVYDTATDTWATKAALPEPAEDFGAAVVGDKIYVIGVHTDVYDPATDTWTTKAAIPNAIAHSGYAVLDNKIYVISGNYHGDNASFYQPITLNQIYDPQTDQWSQGAPIPNAVASASAVATTGINAPKAVYMVGGLVVTTNSIGGYVYNPQNLVQVYYPTSNTWSTGVAMPTQRYALSVTAINDQIYALGGSYSLNPPDSADNELYLPIGYGNAGTTEPPITLYIIASTVVIAVVAIVAAVTVLKRKR
jgi:N-acetylneuraminic acid mutarotase